MHPSRTGQFGCFCTHPEQESLGAFAPIRNRTVWVLLHPFGTGQFGCFCTHPEQDTVGALQFWSGQLWSIYISGSPAHAPLALAEGATSVASLVCRPPAFMNGRRRRGLLSAPCSLPGLPSSRGHPVHSTEDNRHPGAPPIFLMLHTACPHIRTNQTVNQPYTRTFLHALCPAI